VIKEQCYDFAPETDPVALAGVSAGLNVKEAKRLGINVPNETSLGTSVLLKPIRQIPYQIDRCFYAGCHTCASTGLSSSKAGGLATWLSKLPRTTAKRVLRKLTGDDGKIEELMHMYDNKTLQNHCLRICYSHRGGYLSWDKWLKHGMPIPPIATSRTPEQEARDARQARRAEVKDIEADLQAILDYENNHGDLRRIVELQDRYVTSPNLTIKR
jgi:hypothetical protein